MGKGLEAGSKKAKNTKQDPQPINLAYGPTSGEIKSICPPCVSLTCPNPSPSGATGCSGPGCVCTPDTTATVCCLNIDNTITTEGNLNIGNQTVIGDVLVQLNANFKDGMVVEENGNFSNNVCIASDKNVDGNVNIGGFSVVLGRLTLNTGVLSVSGTTGTININSNPIINGSVTVTGNQSVTGSITVGGTAIFNGPIIVSGISGTSGASGAGQVIVNNGSTISGGLIILNPSGCTGCTGLFVGGNACIIGDVIAEDVLVRGQLTVDRLTTLNNVTTATGGTFIVNGPAVLNDGLTITGDEIMQGGSKFVGGNLTVNGDTELQSPVFINEGGTISGGLVVMNGSTVDSLALPSGNLSVSGVVNVNGPIVSSAGISTLSSLRLTDTANSSCPTGPEGALIVLGGAGIGASGAIGKNLWIGGAEYFANTQAEGGVPTSFDYYEESCYATAFTWGGLTVNPPASVMVRVIRVGNIVNLLIPATIYNNPGIHIDVITSTNPMPERFRPFTTVRGASSTIISNVPTEVGPIVLGGLGEYDVSPAGIIRFGIPATASGPLGPVITNALGPQRIFAQDFVQKDIDTITYNINGCENRCKLACT